MRDNSADFARLTRRASRTFYFASLLYPKGLRSDVHILYAFFRTSDDMVDTLHDNGASYEALKADTRRALSGDVVANPIVSAFADLVERRRIDPQLVWDYFASQDLDLDARSYATYTELSKFIYGVAEVVGLCMAKIMGLHQDAYPYARKLGEAMQLVNIARDVDEDARAGKCYIPQDELASFGLSSPLTRENVSAHRLQFEKLMHRQLDRARSYLCESRAGIRFLPRRYILPIAVTMDLYANMIKTIASDPYIIFAKKVKPNTITIIGTITSNWMKLMRNMS